MKCPYLLADIDIYWMSIDFIHVLHTVTKYNTRKHTFTWRLRRRVGLNRVPVHSYHSHSCSAELWLRLRRRRRRRSRERDSGSSASPNTNLPSSGDSSNSDCRRSRRLGPALQLPWWPDNWEPQSIPCRCTRLTSRAQRPLLCTWLCFLRLVSSSYVQWQEGDQSTRSQSLQGHSAAEVGREPRGVLLHWISRGTLLQAQTCSELLLRCHAVE